VCYFFPQAGLKVNKLNFKSVLWKTSEILTNCLLSVTKEHDLTNKAVAAFSGPETTQYQPHHMWALLISKHLHIILNLSE
jgi:hypothetical protein